MSNLGAINVTADTVQTLEAVVVAGAVGIAYQGLALAAAGSSAYNTSRAVTRAEVNGLTQIGPNVRGAASLNIKASNKSTLKATAAGASLAGTSQGLALSVGVALASNKALGAVEAALSNSVLSAGAGVQMTRATVTAEDTATLEAKAIGASLAFAMQGGSLSVGASVARNVAAMSVQSSVTGSTLNVSDAVAVSAKETATLDGVSVA
ncbi:hypothetical protein DAI43_07695, partial [Achromobacter xylosoxidans]